MRTLMLVGGLALVATSVAGAAPSSSTSVVDSFYTWYFSVSKTKSGWPGHLPEAKKYLDPSLYSLLAKMLAEEKRSGGEVLDFDPFVNAQERASSYSVGTASGTHPVKVPVSFHFGTTESRNHLTVDVEKESGWEIENFDYGSQGNLRSILQRELK